MDAKIGIQNGLCEKCLQFKINPASFTSDQYTEQRMHQLGSYQDVYDRKSCPLCQLIAKAYENGPLPYGPKSEASWSKDLRVQGCWAQVSSDSNSSCLRISMIQYHENRKALLVIRPISDSEQTYPHFAKRVTSPLIDFHVAKGWLQDCEKHHKCDPRSVLSSKILQTPAMFRVIDVRKMCVVEPPPGCRYLTLSYVWGTKIMYLLKKGNLKDLSTPGGLRDRWDDLCPTIRDAIDLTRKLDETYLWVDSLCIIQDGGSDILAAINDMDLVYMQAAAMICAADDRSLESGLPGVNLARAPEQYVKEILPGLIVFAQHPLLGFVENSKYASRGWTYQEEQLASCILYLINNQVYYTCLENTYTEEVVGPIPTSKDLVSLTRLNLRKKISSSSDAVSQRYFSAVQEYTTRNLTYPSDVLNAFAGVLATQSKTLNTETHFGLPTCFFDLALLWQPTAQMKRRTGFPSWSWAGWYGSVRWLGDTMELASYGGSYAGRKVEIEKVANWHMNHTWINWQKFSTSSEKSFVWKPAPNIEDAFGEDDIGYRAMHSTLENPFGRKREEDINGIRINSTNPPKYLNLDQTKITTIDTTYLLHFNTISAYYHIRPSTAYLKYGSIDPNWDPQGRRIFHILNKNLAISGYVLLDETWRDNYNKSPDAEHEFIMLSDANYACEWGRPHGGHPYKQSWEMEAYIEYHAMMIRWNEEGVAERVGLGRIHQEALKDAWGEGPIWKEIVLG